MPHSKKKSKSKNVRSHSTQTKRIVVQISKGVRMTVEFSAVYDVLVQLTPIGERTLMDRRKELRQKGVRAPKANNIDGWSLFTLDELLSAFGDQHRFGDRQFFGAIKFFIPTGSG